MWSTASFDVVLEVLHIPDGLPGSSIKHEARVSRELGAKMVDVPYQDVQRRMVSSSALIVSKLRMSCYCFRNPRKMSIIPRWYRITSLGWRSSTIRTVHNMKRPLNKPPQPLSWVCFRNAIC